MQQADFANPPTLLLALQSLLVRARPTDASGQPGGGPALSEAEATTVRAFLRHVRPRLQVPSPGCSAVQHIISISAFASPGSRMGAGPPAAMDRLVSSNAGRGGTWLVSLAGPARS